MKTNLVPLDRGIRTAAGLFLLATPILDLRTYPLNFYGIVLIATALAGYSPLYAVVRWLFAKPSAVKAAGGRGALPGRPATAR